MREDLETRAVGSNDLVNEVIERYGLEPWDGWSDLGGSWTTNLRLDFSDRSLVARVGGSSNSTRRKRASTPGA